MSTADPTGGPTDPRPAGVLDLDHVDYSAFDASLPPAEVSAFREKAIAAEQAHVARQQLPTALSKPMVVGLLVVFGVTFLVSLGQLYIAVATHGRVNSIAIGIPVVFAFLTLASIVQVYKEFADRHWAQRAQLPVFARANGLEYRTISPALPYPGVIFRQGDSRAMSDRLISNTGRYFDLGNLEYWVRSGRSRLAVRWGYLALRLDRNLPNMVLIAKENQGLGGSDLPGTFHPGQVLSLEGDFDKYFTLYCPKEYETDALYVFTPDLMALLIDNVQSFDVEIVDDWMFVVVRKPFPPGSVATLQRLFTIVRLVGAKMVSQTKNYHDDQADAANLVAPRGRRLRTNLSVVRVLITAVVLALLLAVPIIVLILR